MENLEDQKLAQGYSFEHNSPLEVESSRAHTNAGLPASMTCARSA
jgi:hypothetical protein